MTRAWRCGWSPSRSASAAVALSVIALAPFLVDRDRGPDRQRGGERSRATGDLRRVRASRFRRGCARWASRWARCSSCWAVPMLPIAGAIGDAPRPARRDPRVHAAPGDRRVDLRRRPASSSTPRSSSSHRDALLQAELRQPTHEGTAPLLRRAPHRRRLRPDPGALRCGPRSGRGRDRRPARHQRRREVDAAQGDFRPAADDARVDPLRRRARSPGPTPNAIARLGITQVPGGRGVFPRLTVAENLRAAGWLYRKDHEYVREATARVIGYFPVLERATRHAGRQPLGRRAADAEPGEGVHRATQAADDRRAVARAGADDRRVATRDRAGDPRRTAPRSSSSSSR